MTKRLRKQIRELCGLKGLDRGKRRKRAQDILDSLEFKQNLCNKVPGLSFRDIERVMVNILDENPSTAGEHEEEELRDMAPEKFNPDAVLGIPPKPNKKKKSTKQEPTPPTKRYNTWTPEEVRALMESNYDPTDFPRKKG